MLTIADALTLDVLDNTRILGGHAGLGRKITWVNILEVLDEIDQLQEGEMLITTAFGLQENPELMLHLIPQLAKRGLAALAIQTGYYLEEIPESFIKQADQYALPLLELPKNLAFSNVTKAILRRIVDRHIELLEYTERLSKDFTQIVLDNQGLAQVGKVLADLCALPVYIFDRYLDLIVNNGHHLTDPRSVTISQEEANRLRSYPSPYIFEQSKELPKRLIAPVIAGNQVYGFISVLVAENPAIEQLMVSISQAATVAALIFLKENAISETEQRIRGDFLDDLLSGNFSAGEAFYKRAQALGFDPNKQYVVFILDIDAFTDFSRKHSEEEVQDLKQKLVDTMQRLMTVRGLHTVLKVKSDDLVVLLQLNPSDKSTFYKTIVKELKDALSQLLKETTVTIGGGRLYTGLAYIPQSYLEAQNTLTLIKSIWRQDSIGYYEDLGVYRLLISSEPKELLTLYQETVAPLIAKDKKNAGELIHTAEVYLNYNSNIQESSRQLFIHRHTLRYRLNKIQEITGLNLEKPEDRLRLQLGLLSRHVLDKLQAHRTSPSK